jgi:hypothetical protein
MATVEASVLVGASLAETWDAFFDPSGWRHWVDGFQASLESDGYPQAGGTLRWRSIPAGRGEVTERVLDHEPRRRHKAAFEDPAMAGELETRFMVEGDGTRVSQRLEYRLLAKGPIAWLGALLFVRSQVRASMQRTLRDLRAFAEGGEIRLPAA